MKTIIAIWHTAEKGKTETVREIAKILIQTFPDINSIDPIPIHVPPKGDFRLVIEINGVKIGLESQGDPNTNLMGRLRELVVDFECDLIFCTTRTRGETVNAVENISVEFGFDVIWTSTYQLQRNHTLLNNLKAKHLIDLAQNMGLF